MSHIVFDLNLQSPASQTISGCLLSASGPFVRAGASGSESVRRNWEQRSSGRSREGSLQRVQFSRRAQDGHGRPEAEIAQGRSVSSNKWPVQVPAGGAHVPNQLLGGGAQWRAANRWPVSWPAIGARARHWTPIARSPLSSPAQPIEGQRAINSRPSPPEARSALCRAARGPRGAAKTGVHPSSLPQRPLPVPSLAAARARRR